MAVDTSAWVEFLRGDRGGRLEVRQRVRAALAEGAAVPEPVVLEVLAGARSQIHQGELEGLLGRATLLPCAPDDWADGAALYRVCRANGETVRSLIDCLIAAMAIRYGLPVLASDRDFAALARHTPLELAPLG